MSAATMTSDGWTTVGRRVPEPRAPIAPRTGSRYHLRMAEEDRYRQIALEEERKKEVAVQRVAHVEEFPALGGASAPPKTKSGLNAWASKAAAAAAIPQPVKVTPKPEEEHRVRLSQIPTRAYDDGFDEDYDGPDEESDTEFNAELESSRRRGDKGIW